MWACRREAASRRDRGRALWAADHGDNVPGQMRVWLRVIRAETRCLGEIETRFLDSIDAAVSGERDGAIVMEDDLRRAVDAIDDQGAEHLERTRRRQVGLGRPQVAGEHRAT